MEWMSLGQSSVPFPSESECMGPGTGVGWGGELAPRQKKLILSCPYNLVHDALEVTVTKGRVPLPEKMAKVSLNRRLRQHHRYFQPLSP